MKGLAVLGARGRLGSEVVRLASAQGLALASVEEAEVVVVALPSGEVERLLEAPERPQARWLIDLSGVAKRRPGTPYGLVADDGLSLWGGQPLPSSGLVGNPGCIASSVLLGLGRSGVGPHLAGPVHITAVGSRSYAPPQQDGSLRLAHRLREHPHVAEVLRAWPGLEVASFAPVVSYGTEGGLLTLLSGQLRPGAALESMPPGPTETLDVRDVVGTEQVALRCELGPEGPLGRAFTVAVAVDNLTFVAANALRLARLLLLTRGPAPCGAAPGPAADDATSTPR